MRPPHKKHFLAGCKELRADVEAEVQRVGGVGARLKILRLSAGSVIVHFEILPEPADPQPTELSTADIVESMKEIVEAHPERELEPEPESGAASAQIPKGAPSAEDGDLLGLIIREPLQLKWEPDPALTMSMDAGQLRAAMHLAVKNDWVYQMKELVGLGVDCNAPNAGGQTYLMAAAIAGSLDAVEYLLVSECVDWRAKDQDGHTAADLANQHDQHACADRIADDWQQVRDQVAFLEVARQRQEERPSARGSVLQEEQTATAEEGVPPAADTVTR